MTTIRARAQGRSIRCPVYEPFGSRNERGPANEGVSPGVSRRSKVPLKRVKKSKITPPPRPPKLALLEVEENCPKEALLNFLVFAKIT